MYTNTVFLITLLTVYHSYGAVLLWSNHRIEISPLQSFDDEALEELIQELGYPETTVYKTHSSLLTEFEKHLNGYYTAYSPNGDIDVENATEISGKEDFELLNLGQNESNKNVLSVLVIANGRNKREASNSSTESVSPAFRAPEGPVLYKGKQVGTDNEMYSLLYSSQPLLLKTEFNQLYLGKTADDLVVVDTFKDSYVRLNVKIHIEEEDNRITLRFIYSWSPSNYWTLMSVKISDTAKLYYFDLNITKTVTAPAHFSYHCSGVTVFTDSNKTVDLYVYDLQTQIDSTDGKFSDAYDCVDFTTGPILSGLFVSALLGVGLMVALIAISDIKTMDKFDNYKTKQLVVTVSE